MTKILLFDIDGVLNDHTWNETAQSTSIKKSCVKQFNKIIHETGCKLVVSSAWRYMILGGAISPKGFEYMLRTHGCTDKMTIVDVTPSDEVIADRSNQIKSWVEANAPDRWVAVDDMELDLGDNFVKTNGVVGLTQKIADDIIRKLNGET